MSTDWDGAAVASAVSERMAERGVMKKAVAEHAEISTATLRGIQRNYNKHRPTADTLERLSKALGFTPGYLQSVSEGLHQPAAGNVPAEPQLDSGNAESKFTLEMLAGHLSKLDTIEKNLSNVAAAVRKIDKKLDRIAVDIQYTAQDQQELGQPN